MIQHLLVDYLVTLLREILEVGTARPTTSRRPEAEEAELLAEIERIHSALNYLIPAEFETTLTGIQPDSPL